MTPAKNKTVRLCTKVDNILLGLGPGRYRGDDIDNAHRCHLSSSLEPREDQEKYEFESTGLLGSDR